MTQTEAAERARAVAARRGLRLKLHSQTISDYERGTIAKVPADVLDVLAEVYGVSVGQLMSSEPIDRDRLGHSPVPRGTSGTLGPAGPLSRFARPLEQFEREIIRMGAEDAEIDLVRDFFRSSEAIKLFEHIAETAASDEEMEAELDLLMDAARLWVRSRIERRVLASGHGTPSGALPDAKPGRRRVILPKRRRRE